MNADAVFGIIRGARREAKRVHNSAGPAIGIRLACGEHEVCGLLPIDDESDVRFAKFLISEAEAAERSGHGKPHYPLGRVPR